MSKVVILRAWLFRKACAYEGWNVTVAAKQRKHPWRKQNKWAWKYARHMAHTNVVRAREQELRQKLRRLEQPLLNPPPKSPWKF